LALTFMFSISIDYFPESDLLMSDTSEDERVFPEEEGIEKDSRRARKREEDAKAHHIWYKTTGPNVIIRSQLGGTRTSFEAEDAFDISCNNVAHSLNKGKRWERVQNAEQILYEQSVDGKMSFVEASLPSFPGPCMMLNTSGELDHSPLMRSNGGVKKYVEIEDGQISVRKAKSTKTNLASLQRNEGPGPRLKKNRHRARTMKEQVEEGEGAMSDPSEGTQHTRYSTIEVRKRDAKDVERSWRSYQTQHSYKDGWTRKPAKDYVLDWYSEQQDVLEDELDAYYEEQLDSEEPLRLPNQREKIEVKQPEAGKEYEKEEEFPLRETKIQRRQRREKKSAESDEGRDSLIELRPPITSAYMEEAFMKAQEYFNKMKEIDALPVFPRTIIVHKDESEKLLGTKMSRCTFIAAPNATGDVMLYSAPRFCCSAVPPMANAVEGWQSHSRNEKEIINVSSEAVVPPSSLSECSLCKKSEETVELADTVVIQRPSLFSFSCGHLACHSCWLAHAKQNARARVPATTCVNPHCGHASSTSEAAALFSDATIGIFRDFWWDSMCDQEGSVPCYSCARLLIPLKYSYSAAALCPCSARTCMRCGLREHLPLSCSLYARWAAMSIREGIPDPKKPYVRNPVRHLTPSEKSFLKSCYRCGTENSIEHKNWCDKCCLNITIRFEDPVNSPEELAKVLRARAVMMAAEYRQARIDRRLISKKKSIAMEKVVEDGVFLFELIALARIDGRERTLRKKLDKNDKRRLEY
ncbi:hypothetical protein PMAYCL1PPCAC_16486, partial [Pristionchus mayeri]